jgi:PHP family Zn ribbon phosphoesterase
MDLSYSSLRSALFSHSLPPSPSVLGTIEFFPQEGKYHYDGHRKCGVFLNPEEAAARNYCCHVCGKTLTRGVMGRVRELADKPVNEWEPCPANYEDTNRRPFYSLVPLIELIADLINVGRTSKKARAVYFRLIEKGKTEFSILMDLSRKDLEKFPIQELPGETLAEAIVKMRKGEVLISSGYDGEYGRIRV